MLLWCCPKGFSISWTFAHTPLTKVWWLVLQDEWDLQQARLKSKYKLGLQKECTIESSRSRHSGRIVIAMAWA